MIKIPKENKLSQIAVREGYTVTYHPLGFLQQFGKLTGSLVSLTEYKLDEVNLYFGDMESQIVEKGKVHGKYVIGVEEGKCVYLVYDGSHPLFPECRSIFLYYHEPSRPRARLEISELDENDDEYDIHETRGIIFPGTMQIPKVLKPKINLGLLQVNDLYRGLTGESLDMSQYNLPEDELVGIYPTGWLVNL